LGREVQLDEPATARTRAQPSRREVALCTTPRSVSSIPLLYIAEVILMSYSALAGFLVR